MQGQTEHTKRVLILGAGVMQLPALRWARQQGWEVYVADGNPDAPGAELANHFVPVDLTDIEGMVEAAGKIHKDEKLHGVFTAGTDFSYTVASVAKALQLPGIAPEVALNASHKDRMRKVFAAAGVPSPRFAKLSPGAEVDAALENLELPVVVKPVDNMGARGIRRVDTLEEYQTAVSQARRFSRTGVVIVEEYVEGQEFSIDALVLGDEVLCTGIADRHIYFPPYFIEMGHTIPSNSDENVLEAVKKVFTQAVHALEIRNGAAKGDVKWDGRKAVIGEVAARLSGGYMSGWTYPYSSGVELTGNALQLAVGLQPQTLGPTRDWVSAERAFISIPGIVDSVENGDKARSIKWIEEMFIRVSPGDKVDFPTNNVEKSGNFISAASDRSAAVDAAEEACRTVFVRLQSNQAVTRHFLFQHKEAWIPDAFVVENQENKQVLAAMPDYIDRRRRYGQLSPAQEPSIAVIPLPNTAIESSKDWHGQGFNEAWYKVLKLSRVQLAEQEKSADIVVGAILWTAFLRGGVQGAVWLLDSIRQAVLRSQPIEIAFTELNIDAPKEVY
ncbi:MAG: ATP-grasp domain-containing protein [Spirochaetaceae bacterium]|nr:ATP-grasp domain-containing protein [Spirochaetaceae bacterium]MCF7952228.1 ATP-grasp domain-containing protein [Spirochaetaceae bacterium]